MSHLQTAMPLPDTILAPASAPGRSERALIRVSGPGVSALLANPFDSPPTNRGIAPASLKLSPALRLPVLLARFAAPASYTGEDCAEILLPGNPHLVERVCKLLLSQPHVRYAHPGEFTARAYLAGKMSLDEAEGVAAVIAARTDEQLRAASDLLAGATGARYREIADELTTLLALVEAGIDFTDQEDVTAIPAPELASRLERVRAEVDALTGGASGREEAASLPKVVLAGAPNAGKSTLFNALLGRVRAVASPTAGTTRDVLAEPLDLSRDAPGAGAVLLTDIAGIEDAPIARPEKASEREAARAAREAVARADVVLWCDPTGRFEAGGSIPTEASEPGANAGSTHRGRTIIRVRTFGDQPLSGGAADFIAVCALDGWNLATLRRAIADAARGARGAGLAALLPRHRGALSIVAESINEAIDSLGSPLALARPETTAAALRQALDAVGELVGRISPDDVLGRVFATFCVGK